MCITFAEMSTPEYSYWAFFQSRKCTLKCNKTGCECQVMCLFEVI